MSKLKQLINTTIIINEEQAIREVSLGSQEKTLTQFSAGGNRFRPVGKTKRILESGIFKINSDMHGIFFEKQAVKTDELLRFSDERIDSVLNEIDTFWNSRKKFTQLGLLQKRGVLLFGLPGGGKSSVLKFVMEDIVKNDGVIFLADEPFLLNDALKQYKEVEPDRKIVVILEDLEKVMNPHLETKFLNLLDGDDQVDRVLYLATTNHIEELSPRLLRPGRFDRKLKIGFPPASGRKKFLELKLKKIADSETIEDIVNKTNDFTFAQLRELLVSVYVLNNSIDDTISKLKKGIEEGNNLSIINTKVKALF